jgi:hypothetical protein
VVKVFFINEIALQGAKRTQAVYHSFYQMLSTIFVSFLKKNVRAWATATIKDSREKRVEVAAWAA